MVATGLGFVNHNFVRSLWAAPLNQPNIAHPRKTIPVNSFDLIDPPYSTCIEVPNDWHHRFNSVNFLEQVNVFRTKVRGGDALKPTWTGKDYFRSHVR